MFPFSNKRPEKKPENVPVWFMWLLGSFVVYALISSLFFKPESYNKTKEAESTSLSDEARLPEGSVNIHELLVTGAASQYERRLGIRRVTPGGGREAGCWETALLRYQLFRENGELVEDNLKSETLLSVTLGRGEVVPGLERSILGMKKGEVREVALRPDMAFAYPGFKHDKVTAEETIAYRVELVDIDLPVKPTDQLGLKMYDDQLGRGKIAQCTDYVFARVNGWKVDGTSLWNGPRVMLIHVGGGVVPYAVERALIGMQPGGKRTVISPPGYTKPLSPQVAETTIAEAPVAEVTAETPAEKPDDAKPLPAEEAEPRKEMGEVLQEIETDAAAKKEPKSFNFEIPENEAVILEIELLQDRPKI